MGKLLRFMLFIAATWAVAQVITATYQTTQRTGAALRQAESFQELALHCAMEPQDKVCRNNPDLATAAGGEGDAGQ